MFIGLPIPTDLPAPEARNVFPLAWHRRKRCAPLERRSALVTGVYKHLAHLEPEPLMSDKP